MSTLKSCVLVGIYTCKMVFQASAVERFCIFFFFLLCSTYQACQSYTQFFCSYQKDCFFPYFLWCPRAFLPVCLPEVTALCLSVLRPELEDMLRGLWTHVHLLVYNSPMCSLIKSIARSEVSQEGPKDHHVK